LHDFVLLENAGATDGLTLTVSDTVT
jgi:hypothetical protein